MDSEDIKTALIVILIATFIAVYFDIQHEIYYEISLILICLILAFLFSSIALFSIDYFEEKIRKLKKRR